MKWPGGRSGLGFALVMILLTAAGCGMDSEESILMAVGSYGDVALVLSDDSLTGVVSSFKDRLSAPVTYVIRDEANFKVDVFMAGQRDVVRRYKNIIYVVNWSDGGKVVSEVRKLLSDESLAKLQGPEGGVAQLSDPYARYQYAVFVAANDRNLLASLLNRNFENIQDAIESHNRERIRRKFKHEGVRDDLLENYWKQYQFLVEIPDVYRENQAFPEDYKAIEWMRNNPSRGLTLAWRQVDDPQNALEDLDLLLEFRQEIGLKVHNEELFEKSLAWQPEVFGGEERPVLRGAWSSLDTQFGGGGPFECWFVADQDRGLLYCLDLLVYHPNADKGTYFRELEAIAESFKLQRPHR